VNAADVRRIVAELPRAAEGAHHGHPDFRVRNKIFATLSEAEDRAALRLSAPEARALAAQDARTYRLVSDRDPIGWVSVLLEAADFESFCDLLQEAWRLRAGSA
jgi:predicted DNA-binding protein (MmcQ/YjbR family)